MNMAVVGAARVVFGADTSDFDAGAKGVEGVLGRLVDKFHDVERRIKGIGTATTLAITVPFAAMTRTVDKTAGSFEGQMKRVEAALGSITGDELKQLSDQARTLGPAVGKGATEAAEAIEALGLAGVSTADILGGALKAALDLSAAGMVDASQSSALVTDLMGQFGITAAQLPDTVQQIVGALDTSKFGFDDFRLAVGQGGAIAAASGVQFMDFATAISATSSQFSSGADAGTSFKTYIQSLTGKSKEAKGAMKALGLEFFDTDGKMKPLVEQAAMLRDRLGDLNDESKNKALETIFGADAARTAIGLMQQGREGFEKLQADIAGGDVDAKIAKRLEGSEAAGKRIAVAWESLKIALGVDTGLLAFTTALKNGWASLLETIAGAGPGVLKIGAAFSALAAVIGPLLMVLGHVGAVLLANFAASKFGLIGRALGLLISPVSTIISMLGEYGLVRVLTMVGSRLLAITGPIGWAISAFLLFKDEIIGALAAVWAEITATLGPPIEAIITKVQGIFAKLSGGSIGSAIGGLIDLLKGLKDFIGTGLAAGIMVSGEIIERALAAIVAAFGGLVDGVSGMVDFISALLSGDFAGALEAMQGVVENIFGTIIDIIAAVLPEIGPELRAIYGAAKAWLSDGISNVIGWMSNAVRAGVDYIASVFPGVVSAAKAVYQGVKAWLVDAFGGIISFVSGAVDWIVKQYGRVKSALGLGDVAGAPAAPAPPKPAAAPPPAAPPKPKRSVSFDDEDGGRKKKTGGGSGRKPKERDAAEDAADRARLALQNELEAARLRGDREAEEALRRKIDLQQQIEAYQRTGLSLAAATAAAQRDMTALDAARAIGQGKDLERAEAAHRLDLAKIAGDKSMVELLERQQELQGRIRAFTAEGKSAIEATLLATKQQLEVDRARADIRAKLLRDDEQARQLDLARTRGDSDATIRRLERDAWVKKRADELTGGETDAAAARAKAEIEWSESDRARQTGEFRDTFKEGVRAALDGDLKGFVSNWWKDRVAKGMENALNSLADLIHKLLAKDGSSSSGGLGGIISSIASAFGIKGKSTTAAAPAGASGAKLPGFATGGSFKIAGRSGIDQNIVAFRGTAGETVDIRRPGAERQSSGRPISFDLRNAVMTPDLLAQMEDIANETGGRAISDYAKGQVRARRRRIG